MSETSISPEPPQGFALPREDRVMPAVVYALYLMGLMNGVTFIIGVIVAASQRATAGPIMTSHYTFQIRTVWMALILSALGFGLVIVGLPFSLILIGLPILGLGMAILGSIWVWVLVRCVVGAVYLAQDVAYPRPKTWLL